jgi:hypothetical protein
LGYGNKFACALLWGFAFREASKKFQVGFGFTGTRYFWSFPKMKQFFLHLGTGYSRPGKKNR